MANNNIKMGKVVEGKLNPVADIAIKFNADRAFSVPQTFLSEEEFNYVVPDYTKIVEIESVLPDTSSYYDNSVIDSTHRGYVLDRLPTDISEGYVYVFRTENDISNFRYNTVYAYIYEFNQDIENSTIIIYSHSDERVTINSTQYDVYFISNPEYFSCEFGIPVEKIFDIDILPNLSFDLSVFAMSEGAFDKVCSAVYSIAIKMEDGEPVIDNNGNFEIDYMVVEGYGEITGSFPFVIYSDGTAFVEESKK